MYKSINGGLTWTQIGLTDSGTIGRVLVHPTNSNIVYVAASGHKWTTNEMRGVFKTIDGGRTWTKSFYRSPSTGAVDLVMDPKDPNTLYAAMWQRTRRKWSDPRVEPNYTEGGIWKTTAPAPRGRRSMTVCPNRSSAAASVWMWRVRIPTSSTP